MNSSKFTFFSSLAVLAMSSSSANAIDFTDKIYGKLNAKVGYNAVFYQGMASDQIKLAKDDNINTNSTAHGINGGVGFDVFYKATDVIHPFAGIDLNGNYNFNNEFIKDNKFNQYLNVNLKLGSSIKISKDLSINPYGFVGFNLSHFKAHAASNENISTEIKTVDEAKEAIKQAEIRNMINEYFGGYISSRLSEFKLTQAEMGGYLPSDWKEGGYDLAVNMRAGDVANALIYYIGEDYVNRRDEHGIPIDSVKMNTKEDIIEMFKRYEAGYGYPLLAFKNNKYIEENVGVIEKDGVVAYYYLDLESIKLASIPADVNDLIGRSFIFKDASDFMSITNEQAFAAAPVESFKPVDLKRVGLNAGGGIDFVIKDNYSIGVEYRYSEVKFDALKIQTHNIGAKFGYVFSI